MNPAGPVVIGRTQFGSEMETWLASQSPAHQVVVLSGAAGIGKSWMLSAAGSMAEGLGYRVMLAAPGEREADLPYAALADLAETLPPDAVRRLPDPQAEALAAVTLQSSEALTDTKRHAAARGFLTVLRSMAEEHRVLLMIDDSQWLDVPSADVITFAIKRCAVPMLVARQASATRDPLRLAALAGRVPVRNLTLDPLSPLDIGELVAVKLGVQLTRPQVRRLHSASEGNPLYALELVRSDPSVADDAAIDTDSRFADLVRSRLGALDPEVRRLCLLVALTATPAVELMTALGVGEAALSAAIDAEVLVRDRNRLRFTSPVLGAAVTRLATPAELTAAHAALADVAPTAHQRAHHLASSVEPPDLGAASAVAAGALEAAERHGPEAAAPLYEAAAGLLPPSEADQRFDFRARAAAQYVASGDPGRAQAILERLVADAAPGPQRAEAVWRWADTLPVAIPELVARCEEALAEAQGDARLRARLLLQLTTFAWLQTNYRLASARSEQAVDAARESGDAVLIASALAEHGTARSLLGHGLPEDELAPALAVEERAVHEFPAYLRPRYRLGILRMRFDHLDLSRSDLIDELEVVESLADDATRVGVLVRLAELAWRKGEWGRALELATEARSLAATASIDQEHCAALAVSALVTSSVGDIEAARRLAVEAMDRARDGGYRIIDFRATGALVAAEVSIGDMEAAAAAADSVMPGLEESGLVELSDYPVIDSAIEAYLGVGRIEDARRSVELIEERTFPADRLWHRGVAARGRGLLYAADDGDRAREELDEAIGAHRNLGRPFPLARTLLAAGTVKRRTRARGEARRNLTEALDLFDLLGAATWSERTAAELAVVGSGGGTTTTTLTPAETRVAELVVDGYSNKQVAASLFIAVRTVETHLSSIYRKLGIRSRVELAKRFPVDDH